MSRKRRRVSSQRTVVRYPDTSPLGIACKHRDLPRMSEIMEDLIEKTNWRNALGHLRQANQCHRARIREALFRLLDLDALIGADFDPQFAFAGIEAFSLDEVKEKSETEAVYLLKKQVGMKNTFLLDIDALENSRLAILIPRIIEMRQKEILELPDQPSMAQVLSTYYGFATCTSVVSQRTDAPELDPAKLTFEEVALSLGKQLRIKKGRPCFAWPVWKHVSEEMHVLLHNLVRLTMAGFLTKSKALQTLRGRADPRTQPVLELVDNVWFNKKIQRDISEALEIIQYYEFRDRGVEQHPRSGVEVEACGY